MFFGRRYRELWAIVQEARTYARAASAAAHDTYSEVVNLAKKVSDMSDLIAKLQADVAENTRVATSAAALLTSLAQQIRDNATDPAALSKLADDIEANTASLSNAVIANTPTEGELPDPNAPPAAAPASDTTNAGTGGDTVNAGAGQ